MRYSHPELISRLAAEYVLGTLHGGARSRFETLLEERDDFRRHTDDWERRLGHLLERVVEIPPPPAAWETVSARIAPSNAEEQKTLGILQRLGFWKRATFAAFAVLALGIGLLLWPGLESTTSDGAGYMAVIRDDAQRTVWIISALPDFTELEITAGAPLDVPPGKSCYLWVKPESSDRLFVLGLLPDSGSNHIQVRQALRQFLPGELRVSMEDTGPTLPEKPADSMNMSLQWAQPLKEF